MQKKSNKSEDRATDLANQQAAEAAATQQAVQTGTAPTPQEQARINATFGLEQQQLPGLQARAGALPEDLVRQIGPAMAAYQQLVSQRAGQTGQQLLAGISPEAASYQTQVAAQGAQTPEQLFQNLSPQATAYQQLVGAQGTQTPEQLFAGISPTAATLAQTIQQRLQTPPQIPYESTTLPEFQLIQEQINNEAARRGFGGGSGLTFEKLGRAGVDLAIRQAQLRQQNALQNEQLRQQSLAAGGELVGAQQEVGVQAKNRLADLISDQYGLSTDAKSRLAALINSQVGLTEQARGEVGQLGQYAGGLSTQARAELANYLAKQQQLSEAARGRQTQGLAQSYQLAQPFQQNAAEFNLQGLNYLNQRALQRRQDVRGLGQLAGTVAAIGAAPFTGGTSLALLPVLAGMSGGGAGAYNPYSAAGLLGGMQQANAGFTPAGGFLQSYGGNPFRSARSAGGGGFGGFYAPPGSSDYTPVNMQEEAYLRRGQRPFGGLW